MKIGITNEGSGRLAAFQVRGWHILNLEYFATGRDAADVERAIKTWWRRDLVLPVWLSSAEMASTGGWTETVSSEEISLPECIERVRAEADRTHQVAARRHR